MSFGKKVLRQVATVIFIQDTMTHITMPCTLLGSVFSVAILSANDFKVIPCSRVFGSWFSFV